MKQITATCTACGGTHLLQVSEEGYREWRAGELIQRALPELSADQRELLISGTCGPCFDEMFAECEEE